MLKREKPEKSSGSSDEKPEKSNPSCSRETDSPTPTPIPTPDYNKDAPKSVISIHRDIQLKKQPIVARMIQLVGAWVNKTLEKGVSGLCEEFTALRKPIDPTTIKSFLEQRTMGRNRYRDVCCLEATRVILKNYHTDYIHANYVSTPQYDKRFICTQGPLEKTCADFWHMVVQEKTDVILMLCNLMEKGSSKCWEYFPSVVGSEVTFNEYVVKNVASLMLSFPFESPVQIRRTGLRVYKGGQPIHVCDHFQWLDWPDRGVPPPDQASLQLLTQVRKTRTPIVIHCSAGIGRTGSIALIESTIEGIIGGQPVENMDSQLLKLREQRASSVQTEAQYLFVHQVLLCYFKAKGYWDSAADEKFKEFCSDYQEASTP